jgi:predicted nucleotide-binding protein (sugar kinase/HSP70/actin superfamily)
LPSLFLEKNGKISENTKEAPSMLKVTFPHMGNFYISFKSLLYELGVEPVMAPFTTQRTIALGAKFAPEFACLPFKINLGNFIEAIEAGAECIFMVGGSGPCRLGYYGEVQREILQENGYKADFVLLEAPNHQIDQLWGTLKHYLPKHRPQHLARAWQIFWQKATTIDNFDRLANRTRPLVTDSEACDRLQDHFYSQIDHAAAITEIKRIYHEAIDHLAQLPKKEAASPLKIGLLGEIFMVLEPRVNFQIERAMGAMEIEVWRTIYITDWIKENFYYKYFKPSRHKSLHQLAEPYLKNYVGGHGLESVAHTVKSGISHYNGIVHLAPFTCMPEIVAMQIIPQIANELTIPVLSLIIDEHSAEAGIQTRLEAFIDLLNFRKHKLHQESVINPKPGQLIWDNA